ncbi:MAG: putative porin [Planctomycetota bacterium]|jgi:type II secretory pathway pseudopilin PulG
MEKQGINRTLAKLLLVVMTFGLFVPVAAQAAQDDDARIEKLEAAVNALQAELAALKAERAKQARQVAPVVDQKQLEELVNKTFEEKKGEYGVAPDWVNKITPFGDFRYRHETLDNTGDTVGNERRRNRIRARLGFKVEVNEEWDAIFRIASGSSESPTSTNQTTDGAFSSKEIWLDLAYADWHPQAYSGLKVFMGKMKNPFYRVGGNQLIWDSDVNPEGGAASYTWNLSKSTIATLIGGAFWLDERSADADAGYFGIQGMLKNEFNDGSHLLGGVSYYDIGNIDSKAIGGVTLQGNTPTTPGGAIYKYDYDIVEGFAEYGWKYNGMPVAVFGNYLENTAAPEGRSAAYSVGVQLNKAKKPGSWQFKTSYREVESDAVFGGLNDSDFIDGGTGGKGWVLGYKYQLAKNLQAGLTYFINDRDRRSSDASGGSGSQNFNRLQADLIFKF